MGDKELIELKYKLKTEFEQKRHDFIMEEIKAASKGSVKVLDRGD